MRAVKYILVFVLGFSFNIVIQSLSGGGDLVNDVAVSDYNNIAADCYDTDNVDNNNKNDRGKITSTILKSHINVDDNLNENTLVRYGSEVIKASDISSKIDLLPDEIIKSKLSVFFGSDFIEDINDIKTFSKRLLEVSLDNKNINDSLTPLFFSSSPIPGIRLLSSNIVLSENKTIFAHIDNSTRLGNVIAKWFNPNTGEIFHFKKYIIENEPSQFVWFKPNKWAAGTYQVNLYSNDENMTLLASNRIVISDITRSENIDNSILDDLINSGQAITKQQLN